MANLSIRHLSKSYGETQALNNVSVDATTGELLVLLGPSGCGKTTLLRSIAGLEEPDAGDILLNGESIVHTAPHRRDIAFVFQSYALYPNLTVFDNIAFPLRARKAPRADILDKIQRATTMLNLDPALLPRRPRQLSGGQRQRVALARALVRDPALFLLDEPLSNLDAQLRSATRREILKIQQSMGSTMVFVTHDQAEALTLGTKIAVMKAGTVRQFGVPDEVYNRPNDVYVASFLGSPPMNLLTYMDTADDAHAPFSDVPEIAALRSHGRCRTVGFRPEDATLRPPSNTSNSGIVQLLEYQGSETIVTINLNGSEVLIKHNGVLKEALGTSVTVTVPPDALHVFDDNGVRVGTVADIHLLAHN